MKWKLFKTEHGLVRFQSSHHHYFYVTLLHNFNNMMCVQINRSSFFSSRGWFSNNPFLCQHCTTHRENSGSKVAWVEAEWKKSAQLSYISIKKILSHITWHVVQRQVYNLFLIRNYKSIFKCLSLVTYQRLICSTYRDVSKGLSSSTLFCSMPSIK